MNYHVRITRSAEKELDDIPQKISARIERDMELLSVNPRPHQTKKLKNSPYYRLRVGDYRILYLIDDIRHEVVVEQIGHRKDIYR